MTEQLKQSLPAVWKILQDTEQLINGITGTKVKLSIAVTEKHKHHQHLIDVICEYFGISFLELSGKSRKTHLVIARQIFVHLAYRFKESGSGLKEIGDLINRDHTTIMYANIRAKDYLETKDYMFCRHYYKIKQLIENEKDKSKIK